MVQKTATAWVVALFFLFCHAQASTAEVAHLVFGLAHNTDLDICDNGTLLQGRSSSSGTLVFTSSAGGQFAIGLRGRLDCGQQDGEGENLLQNGGFEQPGCAFWELEDPLGKASLTCNGEARIVVHSPGAYYEVQLKQTIPLIEGQWYRLSYEGRSSVRRIKPVGIINPADYDSIGLWADSDLHTDQRLFEYLFRSSETIADARFSLYLSEHAGIYTFDNFELRTVTPNSDCFRPSGDLIINGGFECNEVCQHGWRFEDHFGPGYALCSSEAYSGAHSVELRPAQAGEYYETQYQQLVYVEEGQRYELSFYGKTSGDPQTIVVELVDPQTYANRGLVFGPVLQSQWTAVQQVFTANRTGFARLGIAVGNWGPATPVWIDDVRMPRVFGINGNESRTAAPSRLATTANAAVFTLAERTDVRIEVLDIGGRRIDHEEKTLSGGTHTYIWNGLQRNALRAPSGIYFVRITGMGVHTIKRIVMVR